MDLIDFHKGQIWGITPEAFDAIARRFFESLAKVNSGDLSFDAAGKIAENALYTAQRARMASAEDLYTVENDVAVISITGPLTKRSTFWSRLFGGSSYEDIENAMNFALADDSVGAIVFRIDSPGGVVNGVEMLSDKIFAARSEKPIVAFADGLTASAAYWIGSAADLIVGTKTSEVGSIGVLMTHVDFSQWERSIGIKTTYLSAGTFKTLGNDSEPLSERARQVFQAELDKIYGVFVDTIARNRATTAEDVRERMADGRVFIGDDAVKVGLVDEIGSIESAIATARSMIEDNAERTVLFIPRGASATVISNNKHKKGGFVTMENGKGIKISELTVEMLTEENPKVVKAIADATRADVEKDVEDIVARNTERVAESEKRIVGLAKAIFGEDEGAKLEKVIQSGITVEQYEAIADLQPKTENKGDDKRGEILDELKKAGAEDVGTGGDVGTKKDFPTMVTEYQRANGVKYTEALRAVRKAHPEAHSEYLKSVN